MAKPREINLLYRLEALVWDAYQAGLGALSVKAAGDLGAAILPAIGSLVSANRTALRNLRMAYPNESEAWRRDVARAAWAEIGRTSGEFPHMHKFAAFLRDGRITLDGAEHFAAAAKTGAVFISGHFSNWEVMGVGIVASGVTSHFTYRPANNPLIDKRIIDTRRRYGINLQAAKGETGGMGLMRALARKECIVLMNDQKYNSGIAAPLFGYDCMTADGPTRFALRFRVPLIPLSVKRIGDVRFAVKVHEPIQLDYDAAPQDEIPAAVVRINRFMEARIREAPEQWFWVHQRWPKEAWVKAGVM
jgi:Kdo2-lipid IVA lauroyltransferase/acyltransferase